MSGDAILTLSDVSISFARGDRTTQAVDRLSFAMARGECLALVGESGSGKSVTALALLGLLPKQGTRISGSARFDGAELLHGGAARVRGRRIAIVFQDPLSALSPYHRVGAQIAESFTIGGVATSDADPKVIAALAAVDLLSPAEVARAFPHQLSGGQRQRVCLAMAMACEPELIILDEPTTALDVTVQLSILDLIARQMRARRMSVLFITHDLGAAAPLAGRGLVLYGGRRCEWGTSEEVLSAPRHPYTAALLAALPRSDHPSGTPLAAIPGRFDRSSLSVGCAFAPRCSVAEPRCRESRPMAAPSAIRLVDCHLHNDGGGA